MVSSSSRSASYPGSDTRAGRRTLKGAAIGFGFISEHGHMPAYATAGEVDFCIVAVADTCADRRARARTVLPDARVYASHTALLDAERGRIDFVDVSTPPCDHARITRDALAHGFHVLCEKPLATTAEDARSIVTAARRARRVVFPCHNYKHAPVIKAVRGIIDSGILGRVRLVTLQTFRATHARGADEWRPGWRRERRLSGGGIAMDHGSHTFYLAFDWLGGYPTSITAKMSTLGGFDTEDNFACAITFPSGTATAHLSWTAGIRKVLYTVHGEHGAVRVEDDDIEVSLLYPESAVRGAAIQERRRERVASAWTDASHAGWFRPLFEQFAAAIEEGDFVSRETEDSVRCVELIASAYASAVEGSRERSLPAGLR
jgi:predicted dehydrogenase